MFSEEELIELELYRDQEIDELVDAGFVATEDRWNEKLRNSIVFDQPEMTLIVYTGSQYPVRPPRHEVTNVSLPNTIVDRLRVSLRSLYQKDEEALNIERWSCREDSGYESNTTKRVLQLAQVMHAHLEDYRRLKPKSLQLSDYRLSYKRCRYLEERGFRGLLDYTHVKSGDSDDEDALETSISRGADPFNSDGLKSVFDETEEKALELGATETADEILQNQFGIDVSSISGHETTNMILGKTPQEIASAIPEEFRVLHIENIVRSDCVRRFWNVQSRIRRELSQLPVNLLRQCVGNKRKISLGRRGFHQETLLDVLIEPEVTFHGTEERFVPSIVQHGFLKPDSTDSVRCGSTYGLGIYSSPDPLFALRYSPIRGQIRTASGDFGGLKLIVCALIPGRPASVFREEGNWRESTSALPGAHCHVGNDGLELIAFDSAQILPCYVVHLDLGRDACQYLRELDPPDRWFKSWEARRRTLWAHQADRKLTGTEAPGDRRRIKESLMAQVRKNLPYGYGAATGNNFQILEVGEVSDDEEDYGLYQKDRMQQLEQDENFDFWEEHGDSLGLDWTVSGDSGSLTGDTEETRIVSSGIGSCGVDADNLQDGVFNIDLAGRAKVDRYYDARIAKNKKTLRTLGQLEKTDYCVP